MPLAVRVNAQPCMFAEFAAALAAMTSPGDGGTAHSAMITVETDPAGLATILVRPKPAKTQELPGLPGLGPHSGT